MWIYVALDEQSSPMSFNIDEKKIYINPFNKDLSIYSISILDVVIALEVASALSDSKEDLKKHFYVLLGLTKPDIYKFVAPLRDELRRRGTMTQHVI